MRLIQMKKSKHLNFINQHIYVGIDVHSKQWTISIMSGDLFLGSFTQAPDATVLIKHLRKNYPGGRYHCVYEAGFSGFGLYEDLLKNSIDCIVINPADVPTTHKEKDRKTDKFDSRKLCKSLQRRELEGIYVHDPLTYEERCLIRGRALIIRDQTRCKNRIKSLLKFFSINITDEKVKAYWSNKYIKYLEGIETPYRYASDCLKSYIEQLRYFRKIINDQTRQIRKLSLTEKYSSDVKMLMTIPGVSLLSAMTLLSEIGDINRFKTVDRLCGYIGLIPSEHSSGERQNKSIITRRGNKVLRSIIIESSWIAIRKDPELLMCYNTLGKRMKKTRAIMTIARKLICRIVHILKNKEPYKICVNC